VSWLSSSSFDDNDDITLEYSSDSTAVITPGAGRKGTAGVVTNGTTFFTLDRVAVNQDISALTLIRNIAMKLDALPGSTGTIFQFQETDNTNQICIGVLTNGVVRAFRGNTGGSTLASSPFPIAPDIYYFIESKVFVDDVTGTVEVRIWNAPDRSLGTCTILDTEDTVSAPSGMFTSLDVGRKISFSAFTSHVMAINSSTEVQVADTNSSGMTISGTGTITYIPAINFTGDTKNGGTGTLGKIKHGLGLSASWDDATLFDTEGSAFNNFKGDKHIEAHTVDGVGFYTNWVPIPSAPNWGNVDEIPPDGNTSYNFAPDSDPASAPTFVSVSSSTLSASVNVPMGITEGDLLILIIRTLGSSESSNIIPGLTAFVPPGTGIFLSEEGTGSVGGLFLFDPFISPGADSSIMWCTTVAAKLASGSEPGSYGPFLDINGDPLENVAEIAVLCYTGVNQSFPIESTSNQTAGASPTGDPPSSTLEYAQINALTSNALAVAIGMPESQVPATPTGYTNNYASSHFNVASKLIASPGGQVPPDTTIGAVETWGTSCMMVKARTQIETGGMDTFTTQDTTATSVDGVMVKLCTKVDVVGHTVGAVMRQASTDSASEGVAPTTNYLTYQFPYELAPDGGAWSAAKYSASETGYALDAAAPPPPPEEAVLFEVDASNYTGTYGDGDPINSIVETGQFGLTLSLAHTVTGDYHQQTYDLSAPAVNNKPSILGLTESLTCTPSDRSIGYLNLSSPSNLFLPNTFTIACVFNITQFEGCWANGANIVLVGRKGNNISNFCGWQLQLDGGGDPGGQGELSFNRINAVGSNICQLLSGFPSINESTTCLGVVICDGTTVRLRLNSVEVDSAVYATSVEPVSNNQLNYLQRGAGFGSGNADGCPQGNVPFCKIWSVELSPSDLTTLESDLTTLYGI